MSLATESMNLGNNPMATALAQGLDTLDLKQSVTFDLYVRKVLPADGFVFWVKASILQPPPDVGELPFQMTVEGSLHHATVNTQSEDENFSTHKIIFTAKSPVNNLGAMAPDTLYMASVDGNKYAFSARSSFYKQADLYHYSGDAVYPSLADMVVDDINDLDLTNRVISNSLPIWLMFTHAIDPTFENTFPIYPSYLLPDNLLPPYATIDIDPSQITNIGAGKFYDGDGNRLMLATEKVEVSLFGIRNDAALDWMDAVVQYGLDHPDTFGVQNSPVMRDAKRGQVEISALAQKKNITFQVNYYQTRLNAIVLKYILSAFIDQFLIGEP